MSAPNQQKVSGYTLIDLATGIPYTNVIPFTDFRQSASMGRIPGASSLIVTGSAFNIDKTRLPFLLSEAQLPPKWMVGPTPMEIFSSSPNDASNGTGAQTIEIKLLDGNYVESVVQVKLNGISPVKLPIDPQFINGAQVVAVGGDESNVGNIVIRTSASGLIQGYIPSGLNSDRSFRYTVPAGKTFLIDNFYNTSTKSSAGDVIISTNFNVRNQNGIISRLPDTFTQSSDTSVNVILPTPFAVKEKSTIFTMVVSATVTGANYGLTAFGVLIDNT